MISKLNYTISSIKIIRVLQYWKQEKEVEPYPDVYRFPPEIKADKKHFPLSLVGYDTQQQMVYARQVGDKDVDELIAFIFKKHPEVDYLHARNAEACCFICKIERIWISYLFKKANPVRLASLNVVSPSWYA